MIFRFCRFPFRGGFFFVCFKLRSNRRFLFRLRGLAPRMLRPAEAELGRLAGTLDALSPLKVLSRGYAIATDDTGHVIKEACELQPGQAVGVRLGSGSVIAQVLSINP